MNQHSKSICMDCYKIGVSIPTGYYDKNNEEIMSTDRIRLPNGSVLTFLFDAEREWLVQGIYAIKADPQYYVSDGEIIKR